MTLDELNQVRNSLIAQIVKGNLIVQMDIAQLKLADVNTQIEKLKADEVAAEVRDKTEEKTREESEKVSQSLANSRVALNRQWGELQRFQEEAAKAKAKEATRDDWGRQQTNEFNEFLRKAEDRRAEKRTELSRVLREKGALRTGCSNGGHTIIAMPGDAAVDKAIPLQSKIQLFDARTNIQLRPDLVNGDTPLPIDAIATRIADSSEEVDNDHKN